MTTQTTDDLIAYLKQNCSVIFSEIQADSRGRIQLTLNQNISHVELRNGLHYVLGFDKPVLQVSAEALMRMQHPTLSPFSSAAAAEHTAEYVPQLKRGFMSMYIYASICKPIYVGHTCVPLLKNVFIDTSADADENGSARNNVVYNPMYIPVASTSFNSIEINIRNDGGQLIPFPDGAITIVTLHFKRTRITTPQV